MATTQKNHSSLFDELMELLSENRPLDVSKDEQREIDTFLKEGIKKLQDLLNKEET